MKQSYQWAFKTTSCSQLISSLKLHFSQLTSMHKKTLFNEAQLVWILWSHRKNISIINWKLFALSTWFINTHSTSIKPESNYIHKFFTLISIRINKTLFFSGYISFFPAFGSIYEPEWNDFFLFAEISWCFCRNLSNQIEQKKKKKMFENYAKKNLLTTANWKTFLLSGSKFSIYMYIIASTISSVLIAIWIIVRSFNDLRFMRNSFRAWKSYLFESGFLCKWSFG